MSRQILMINPNVTEAITDVMAVEARRVAGPETTIHAVTAEFGTLYIENRVEAAIAGHAVVDSLAKNGAGMDGDCWRPIEHVMLAGLTAPQRSGPYSPS